MAESLLRFPSNGSDTDFQGHSPALLITSEHTCGDDNSPRLEDNTHSHIPAQFESAMAVELDKEVRLTLLTLFLFSHPPRYLFSQTGCSCLTAVIQGDFLPPPSEQRGLGGIFECRGCWLLALWRLCWFHPCLIHPCFWCQSSGIWLVSCDWLPLWIFKSLNGCSFAASCILVGGRKVTSVFLSATGLTRAAWWTVPILNIGHAYFVCPCSSRSASASENANEAATNISHHACSAHTDKPAIKAQMNKSTYLSDHSLSELISCLNVARGPCDLTYQTSQVVLGLKYLKRKDFKDSKTK